MALRGRVWYPVWVALEATRALDWRLTDASLGRGHISLERWN
jgi:hypothetical protein